MKDYKVKYIIVQSEHGIEPSTARYKIVRETTTYIKSTTDWTIATDLSYDASSRILQEFRSLQSLQEKT